MSSSKSSSEKTNLNPKVPVATKEPKGQPTKTLEEIDTNVNWQIAKGTPSTTEFSVRKSFEVEIASSKETEAAVVVDSVVATSTDAQEVVPWSCLFLQLKETIFWGNILGLADLSWWSMFFFALAEYSWCQEVAPLFWQLRHSRFTESRARCASS